MFSGINTLIDEILDDRKFVRDIGNPRKKRTSEFTNPPLALIETVSCQYDSNSSFHNNKFMNDIF